MQQRQRVSIHAPVRGATTDDNDIVGFWEFQSTPLCEGRQWDVADIKPEMEFQSTPLCEGRRARYGKQAGDACFNPRPCARGDA